MAAFANRDFFWGTGVARAGASDQTLSRAKAAIVEKLKLDEHVGKPADTGELILHVSDYVVEEAP